MRPELTSCYQVVVVNDDDPTIPLRPDEIWDLLIEPRLIFKTLAAAQKFCEDDAKVWVKAFHEAWPDHVEEGTTLSDKVTWSRPEPNQWDGSLANVEVFQWSAFITETKFYDSKEITS